MSHQIHTIVYVDGENFTIRLREFEQTEKPFQDDRYKQSGVATRWIPQPSNLRIIEEHPFGATWKGDTFFWDFKGLDLAYYLSTGTMLDSIPERCVYFASCPGDQIQTTEKELHDFGFEPQVFKREKPDSFAKEKKAEGITVITRPKQLDIAIATRVLEDAANNTFHQCILVAGDEDYVPLVEAVKRKGKIVWVLAFRKYLSKHSKLEIVADRFLPFDDVVRARYLLM